MAETKKRGKFFAVSNAHLDTQWNWTVIDTIRDCIKNTMEQNFALLEKYPGYKFNFEGAFRYALMAEYYPEEYEKVKKYVSTGRWNPVGATWDAMDVNVPSSEALMRQILYGNNYFEKEFGKISDDIFLPDCFGFRQALPSIMEHMGLSGFSTQKLVWGAGAPLIDKDGKVLPPMPKSTLPRMDLGRWIGPNGKGVYVSLLCGAYEYNFDKNQDERPINEREELLKMLEANEQTSGVPYKALYYGTGDYGGSCSDGSAKLVSEAVEQPAGEGLFDVVSASPTDIYKELTKEESDALPIYDGSLLIPHGYGAMVSHATLKRLNRYNEGLLDRAERIAVMAELIAGEPYPKETLTFAAKLFLWHQFHDDLTGTSIADAYNYSHNDQFVARNLLSGVLKSSLKAVERRFNTLGDGDPILLYNPSAFEREEAVTIPTEFDEATVYDPAGRAIPTACYNDNGNKYITFRPTMPSLSVSVCHVRPQKTEISSELKISTYEMENRYLTVKLDENGNVASIFDRMLGKELLSGAIRPTVYGDHSTTWPSWEINYEDIANGIVGEATLVSIEPLDHRPVSVGFKVTQKYNQSEFITVITLVEGAQHLRFDCETHWYEHASLLVEQFPLAARNEKALFDSGMGAVYGGITDSFPYYIHNVHRWADQRDKSNDLSVMIANDCKYAMFKPDNKTLALCLIHTPSGGYLSRSGQNYQDLGVNYYSFTIEGHRIIKNKALKNAEALNTPITVLEAEKHEGIFNSYSLIEIKEEGVSLQALKKAEKENRYILRFQETAGQGHRDFTVHFPMLAVGNLFLCNGYEQKIKKQRFYPLSFQTGLHKYDAKTFSLSLYGDMLAQKPRELPVELPFNADMISHSQQFKIGFDCYLPRELFPTECTALNTHFVFSEGENNTLLCNGQTLSLPKQNYRYARILAFSLKERKNTVFTVGSNENILSISSISSPIGTVESVISGSINSVNSDDLALVFTHTHAPSGEDRIYNFAYLFCYQIALDGADKIILPNDPDIALFAMTLTDTSMPRPLSAQYDNYGEVLPSHHLYTVGCTGEDILHEGALKLLTAEAVTDEGVFESFECEGIVWQDGCHAIVRMGEHDLTVTAKYRFLGKDLAQNKPIKANHEMSAREAAVHTIDGSINAKWCGIADENGICTLDIDLEEMQKVSSYLICHAGPFEHKGYNTSDFKLLSRATPNDEWTVLDEVTGNTEDITYRNFEEHTVRYLRLSISKQTQGQDRHARIYRFSVYG